MNLLKSYFFEEEKWIANTEEITGPLQKQAKLQLF
jgi:hypothetical protein